MRITRFAAVLLLAGSTLSALAGPPMVCHEIAIGQARSLPWDGGHGGSDSSYDVRNLTRDTLKILDEEPSTLVRMETIRRAAVYISHEKSPGRERLGWDLVAALVDRAVESSAAKPGPAFDAGYLLGCFNQLGLDIGQRLGRGEEAAGYAYVASAIQRARAGGASANQVAEMEFAAALITHPAMRARGRGEPKDAERAVYDAHIARAAADAAKGSPLEVNLAAHLKQWGTSIETVRAGKASQVAGPR